MKISTLLSLAFIALTLCTENSAHAFGRKRVKVSFVLTNDIHGHLEPTKFKTDQYGGLSTLSSIVDQIRSQPEYQNEQAALFVLDSGDQFQGTLMSNFDEGQTVFKAFNKIHYDAIIPGNHDYDFGPLGWLVDQVVPGQGSTNPREVIERLAAQAEFPMLSANTYYKSSIRAVGVNTPIPLTSDCKPSMASFRNGLDFTHATRPNFLKPYTIIEKAGVRVALIGLDNHATASTTTPANVNDLCFRNEVDTYVELRQQLDGQADVFVILMHNGNSSNSFEGSNIARDILARYPDGVDLIAAGHTHFIHNADVDGVKIVQDGSEGKYFGRVDLYVDKRSHRVLKQRTQSLAGIKAHPQTCDAGPMICSQLALPIPNDTFIDRLIAEAKAAVAPLADRLLGSASEEIKKSRIAENAMGNILTDAMRQATNTDIALMNMGGIRTTFQKGSVTYQNLFEVIPFNNIAVTMNVPWRVIQKSFEKSVKSCGISGVLVQSGLKIRYNRTCAKNADTDSKAKLTHIETLAGEVIFDVATNVVPNPDRIFRISTLDFIAAGGSGYTDFAGVPVVAQNGIAREVIADQLELSKPAMNNQIDNRLLNEGNDGAVGVDSSASAN